MNLFLDLTPVQVRLTIEGGQHYFLALKMCGLQSRAVCNRVNTLVAWAYLRILAAGQHSSEETSQRWRAVCDTVSDFDRSGKRTPTSSADSDVLTTELNDR